VDEAHALRRKTAAHAHGATGAKRAIRAGIDSIEHGTFLDDDALEMMRARGTYYIPTLMAPWWLGQQLEKGVYMPPEIAAKVRTAVAAIDATFRKALAQGVRIGLGTDAGVYPHGDNAKQFETMTEWGMKPIDAIRAATVNAAELLGRRQEVGVVAKGAFADIIAVQGDPREQVKLLESVKFVMKAGRVYKNDWAK
jgi:imidazolonepropionase-like amidohydrolase